MAREAQPRGDEAGNVMDVAVSRMLQTRTQLKVYHWQTKSFARHKAIDQVMEGYDETMDRLVETWQGAVTRRIRVPRGAPYAIENLTCRGLVSALRNFAHFLRTVMQQAAEDLPDVLNLRDEMLAFVNQLLYLLSLR